MLSLPSATRNFISKAIIAATIVTSAMAETKPIKVFILAGDENCLEQGVVEMTSDGSEASFYPGDKPVKDERTKHVNCAVYQGAYAPGTNYDTLKPEATGVVEIGAPRMEKGSNKNKVRQPIPLTPFPALAEQDGHTTELRGYVSVARPGLYQILPGAGESAFNVTTLEGKEVYRRDIGQQEATITPVQLEAKKRCAFKTIFFKKPGHEFRVLLGNKPGTLESVVTGNKEHWGFLKDADGGWGKRDDVVVYDGQPMFNNTKAMGRLLGISADPKDPGHGVAPDLMLGQILGEHFEEPVFIHRFATRHPIGFLKGSRSLGQDYMPPSSGGDPDLKGNWDIIHFNFGVHDTAHRNPNNYTDRDKTKYPITVPIEQYEANLRKMVSRMKTTGATLVWARTTPLPENTDGWVKGIEDEYNAVADRIMKENDVMIDDLHAESIRQGFPKSPDNVHSVGNLAPKVTETILAALANRKQSTKPFPRVLLIGDSITGTYIEKVTKNLDGKASIYMSAGNAGHTGNGLAHIEEWLDLKRYLQSGQEYLQLVDSVKDMLAKPEKFIPNYKNQGVELAGMVWFQGIADSQSNAFSSAYEKNLANLIRDVRKEFKSPTLPIIVTAIGFGGTTMNANTKKIHDAQMAVGNPEKYQEFADNVKSIDTLPFYRTPELSPGAPAFCYNTNAESFLEIGETMGRAMLELFKPTKTTK